MADFMGRTVTNVNLTEGDDLYTAPGTVHMVQGYGGSDTIYGNALDNIIFGETRNDPGGFDADATRTNPQPDEGDYLYGYGGNDLIHGQGGGDLIDGGDDNDTLYGGDGNDRVEGGSGTDYVYGGEGHDTVMGEGGTDFLYGDNGDDLLRPGAGAGNYANGGAGTDTLDYQLTDAGQTVTIDMEAGTVDAGGFGSATFVSIENVWGSYYGPNFITGDDNDNEIFGGSDKDEIRGGQGDDYILGYDDNDVLYGGVGSDRVQGGNGHDEIFGSRGHDLLIGGAGSDTLLGGKGGDTLVGARGGDVIYGHNGGDKLDGRDGKDRLIAGSGSDKLYGGKGSDIFEFYNSSDYNKIMDFEAKDTIAIGSGASKYSQLKFKDTSGGLRIEFGDAEINLKGLDMGDIDKSNFDFF